MSAGLALAGKRILIVEDEFLIGASLSALLGQHGCLVEGPVDTANTAIEMISRGGFDGAVVDVKLRDGLGFDVAHTLRKQRVPFVIVTGYQRDHLPPEFRDAFYLSKPALPDVLIEILSAALQSG